MSGTIFPKKDIYKGTWLSPTGQTVNQIDQICVAKRWSRSLQDMRVFRGADINTSHYLLKATFKIRLSKRRISKAPKIPDLEKLRNGCKVNTFTEGIQTQFDASNPISLEEDWGNFVKAFNVTSKDVLGTKPRHKKTLITSEETKKLLEERRKVKQRKKY